MRRARRKAPPSYSTDPMANPFPLRSVPVEVIQFRIVAKEGNRLTDRVFYRFCPLTHPTIIDGRQP